jgi:hypothetical protein
VLCYAEKSAIPKFIVNSLTSSKSINFSLIFCDYFNLPNRQSKLFRNNAVRAEWRKTLFKSWSSFFYEFGLDLERLPFVNHSPQWMDSLIAYDPKSNQLYIVYDYIERERCMRYPNSCLCFHISLPSASCLNGRKYIEN